MLLPTFLSDPIPGNFFPCSCQLLMVQNSHISKTDKDFFNHNFCVSPYSLHGSPINTVNKTTLSSCPTPTKSTTRYVPETTTREWITRRTSTGRQNVTDHIRDTVVTIVPLISNGGTLCGSEYPLRNLMIVISIFISINSLLP